MEQTPNLKLPYIAPSQAQKHVTHNEAIRALDALVQLCVASRDLSAPPDAAAEGERHIIAAPATGAWKGRDGWLAAWLDGGWFCFPPQEGWHAWVAGEGRSVVFHKSRWMEAGGDARALPRLGIGADADDYNRLVVRGKASLFDDGGDGHELKLNRAQAGGKASILFQTGYSGRAEMGTIFGPDFSIKTSADNATWHEAMVADTATGAVRFPSGVVHARTGKTLSGLIFLPEPEPVFVPAIPASATVEHVAPDAIGIAEQAGFFPAGLRTSILLRLWNVSLSPAIPAWFGSDPATGALRPIEPAQIAEWRRGHLLHLAGPDGTIALDISPVMQRAVGTVLAQAGVLLAAETGDVSLPCAEKSPVSASNLVHIRADERRSLRLRGLYG
ncbi:DUF2793 domain-containing protein [Phyllobacterium sp. 0TCS1.6C]|uniref:DUF2793 domain-containing protein n=1 Tax=unclassified Phyllobacterium TaxID=2638441 RepID=UPI0022654008|nr:MULTISPECIES: DUF2793 domain-containing protein [unclassified Phyllobacterium]MCX8281348.1 DUF2793 domain-containing protein [Phyllobacterium sp. 0TCS1.6C]MCX8295996.1 DUF2793 domain-containing protein [Phyllobacterium sp. 0TCS1.6A]